MYKYDLIDGSICELRSIVYETTAGSARDRWVVGIGQDYGYYALRSNNGSSVWEIQTPRRVKQMSERLHDAAILYLHSHPHDHEPWADAMIADSKKLVHILYLASKPPLTNTEIN